MEDKKPCDDIFDGLAEMLIKNGEIKSNYYTRERHGIMGIHVHTTELWSVNYGECEYVINATDGEFDSIRRVRIDDEGSDE